MHQIDRRNFISGVGRAVFGVAAMSNASLWAGGRASAATDRDWAALSRELKGQLLRPNSPQYATTGISENLAFGHGRPAGIALCTDAQDVQKSLRWARDNGVPLVAQSGGHSYAGYSTTRGLLISVRPIDAVAVDRDTETATIGTGIQLGSLYKALFGEGVFVPAGRCASVGVAGYVLGGGFGFETRRFGMACDRLVETQIVTADGELLTCNETENADLFWACRGGGGGNFGINTRFTLRTTPIINAVYGKAAWRFEDAEAVWPALSQVAMTARPRRSGHAQWHPAIAYGARCAFDGRCHRVFHVLRSRGRGA